MNRRAVLAFLLVTSLGGLFADERSTSVDFVILVDTSLSMASAIDEAKRYAAGEIVGRLVMPGDWITIVRFYGDNKIVWQGDVASEADISTIVRSLHELKADGRFTDIGAALDAMDKLVLERNRPERPKYILLLTDERQEAPKGSAYYSSDFIVSHPLLEYVKKVDMGSFRVITIGYGLSAKIAGEARSLMTTLSEPPDRPRAPIAGSEAGSPSEALAGSSGTPQAGGTSGAAGNAVTAGDAASKAESAKSRIIAGAPIAAGLAAAGAFGVLFVFFIAKKRKRGDKEKDDKKAGPSA